MSRVCGIEIKSKTACLVILEGSRKSNSVIKSNPLKIELNDSSSQDSIKSFSNEINDYFKLHDIEKVFIKEGASKGKFTSGAPVFKIETIFQMSNVEVNLVSSQTLNAFYKKEILDLDELDLKKYQHVAYQVAYYAL